MSCRVATRSGFTLLEMLLALAIMAVLSTALYASLHTGFDARSRAEASVAPTRAVAVALEMIGRDIASALPPTGILAGAFTGSDATGATASGLNGTGGDRVQDADSLQFYAVIFDQDRGGPGIQRIEFLLMQSEDGSDTVLVRHATANLLAPVAPAPDEEVLCRRVASFNLRYFDGTSWLDTWDSTTQGDVLPLAVEVRLEIIVADGGGAGDANKTRQLTRVCSIPCGQVASNTGQSQTTSGQ